MAGAPIGNRNAAKAKMFEGAIRAELNADDRRALQKIAKVLVDMAEKGDLPSIKEVIDRTDGKPTTTIAGDPENPLQTLNEIKVKLVGSDSGDT